MGYLAELPHRPSSETDLAARTQGDDMKVRTLTQTEIDALWNRLRDRRRAPLDVAADQAPKIA